MECLIVLFKEPLTIQAVVIAGQGKTFVTYILGLNADEHFANLRSDLFIGYQFGESIHNVSVGFSQTKANTGM